MADFTGFLATTGITTTLPMILAQSSADDAATTAAAAGINLVTIVIQLALYAFIAFCTYTYLKKLDYENPWFAFIPIVHNYAILEAGEQEDPLIWTIVSCIPCVGLISLIKIIPAYITICERLGKPPAILWTFLLCGLGGLIVPVVLAFT
jgi:hypothetical protein